MECEYSLEQSSRHFRNHINLAKLLSRRSPEASWHTDYRDTAFIYFGGLSYELSEGDIITIFSQYGEPVFLKLVRDKETGKSKGFGWLKYDDQRSTDLAVDNLGGAEINGRMIRVDHARYKPREDEDLEAGKIGWEDMQRKEGKNLMEEDEGEESEESRPLLPEERELQLLIRDHDGDDPMKEFLIDEKKREVAEALRKYNRDRDKRKKRRHRQHHRSHRPRRNNGEDLDSGRDNRRHQESDRGGGRDRYEDKCHERKYRHPRRRHDDRLNDMRDSSRERRKYRDIDDDYEMRDVDDLVLKSRSPR